MAMIPFHTRCEETARKEIRSFRILTPPEPGGLPMDEYAILEFYCEDSGCDCRRGFFQIISNAKSGMVLASINFGWESGEFYRKRNPYVAEAAREITEGSLDPLNQQSKFAPELLVLFQQIVADRTYRMRLKRHYEMFRAKSTKSVD